MSSKKEKSLDELALPLGFLPSVVQSDDCLFFDDDSIKILESPVNLHNIHSVGVEIKHKFTPKRKSAELLSASYARLGFDYKALNVAECGTFLEFAHELHSDGTIGSGKLHNANFCKDRLCPMCAWRRSYKIFAQVSKIMDSFANKYKFLFLTLTVPNCAPVDLSKTISRLMVSWNKFIDYKAFKTAVLGFFRALEVTRNSDTGQYHPHFHCVLAVPLSYGKRLYISREDWLLMWQKAYKDTSITQVDIRLARPKSSNGDLSSAVAEIAKYAVKSSEYIIDGNSSLTDKIVSELCSGLRGRRLTAYGGVFKEAYRQLSLDDAEDGDLVHLGDINSSLRWLITRYGWTCGVYKLCQSFIQYSDFKE